MSILLPLFISPFGVAVRGKGKLTILALISPYSEKPKVRHVSDFNSHSAYRGISRDDIHCPPALTAARAAMHRLVHQC